MAMGFHILAQDGIDHRLVTPPLLLEKLDNVRVETKRYLLLRAGPENRLLEKVFLQGRNVGTIDFCVLHRLNAHPVCF